MEYQRITLRIPTDLHERLMAESEDKSRSMNAEVIERLRSSLDEQSSCGVTDEDRRRYPVWLTIGLPETLHENLKRTAERTHRTINGALVVRLETTYYRAKSAINQEDNGEYSTALARSLVRMLNKQIAEHDEWSESFYAACEEHAAEEAEFLASLTQEERQRHEEEKLKAFDSILLEIDDVTECCNCIVNI